MSRRFGKESEREISLLGVFLKSFNEFFPPILKLSSMLRCFVFAYSFAYLKPQFYVIPGIVASCARVRVGISLSLFRFVRIRDDRKKLKQTLV